MTYRYLLRRVGPAGERNTRTGPENLSYDESVVTLLTKPTVSDLHLSTKEKPIRCELVTWGEVYRLSRRVAWMIRDSGFRPDIVVAIARGGYIPARLLCDFLNLYNLVSIRIAHYEAGAQRKTQARLSTPLPLDISGLEVLLVDDVSDTGDTLALAIEHIQRSAPADMKVVTLHHKQVSPIVPDFFGQKIMAWRWLIYPWAVVEDLSGLLARMTPCPDSPAAAIDHLKQKHGIAVSKQTAEDVLAVLRLGHGQS